MMRDRFAGVRRVLRVRDVESDIDEEIAFHLERTTEELVASGMPPARAREEAERRFGNRHHYRREMSRLDRGANTRRRWEGWWHDVRHAVRRMARWPGLTAAVVLTFALGIGANATMFGIIDRLLLSPPAHVTEPEAVRRVAVDRHISWLGARTTSDVLTHLDFTHLSRARSFARTAAFAQQEVTLGHGADASRRRAVLATGDFFTLLGVRPVVGRFWTPEDDRVDAPPVAVLAYHLWRHEFGGDAGVVGRTVDLGHGPYTVIGVAPQRFTGVDLARVDLWLPLESTGRQILGDGWPGTHNFYAFHTIGRLAPGVTPEQAAAELTMLLRQGRAEEITEGEFDPDAMALALSVIGAQGPMAGTEVRVAKWLAGVSLLVLLIACANVANLLLARMIRQRREIAIRLALGISRRRLVAQAVVESVLLAALGGASALLVAWWSGRFVRSALLPDIEWGATVPEPRVVAVVVLLAAAAGVLAGLLPALQASRPDVLETLRSGARQLSSPATRTRSALIVFQTTLAVVLLVGAGLFVTSLQRVHERGLGLDARGVLVIEPVFERGVDAARQREFYRLAAEHLAAMPAVEHAAAAFGVPFRMAMGGYVHVPGLDSLPRLPGGGPYYQLVDPDYFATLRLPMLQGRGFDRGDLSASARTVVISETMARTLWPGTDAVGRCLVVLQPDSPCAEVIGVVRDARRFDPTEDAAMQFYLPRRPDAGSTPHALLLRVAGDPRASVPAIQRELLQLGTEVRFAHVRPLQELVDPRTRSWTLGATMFTVFGVLALVVAAIGLYSVLAFAVAQRTHELGIRAALGASRERLMGLVVGQGIRLVTGGVGIGVALSLLAGGWIGPLLFDTSPREPVVFAVVSATLLLVALVAATLPGIRATRVSPTESMRSD